MNSKFELNNISVSNENKLIAVINKTWGLLPQVSKKVELK